MRIIASFLFCILLSLLAAPVVYWFQTHEGFALVVSSVFCIWAVVYVIWKCMEEY